MIGDPKDDLMMFLMSRDPVTVAREWHVVTDREALMFERPKMVAPRRKRPSVVRRRSFAELRAERMLEVVRGCS